MSTRAGSGNMECGADNSTHGRSRSNSEHSDMSSKAGSEDMDTGTDHSSHSRSRSISERSDFSSRAGSDHNYSSSDDMDSDDIRADLNMDRSDLPENFTSLPTDQQQSNPSILASKHQEDEAVASSSRKGNCNVQEGGVCYPAKTFQQYYDEIIRLQTKNDELEAEVQKCRRGLKFVEDDRKCLFYTGISSYETFFKLFKFLEPSLDQPVCNLSKDQLLVLTLTRLRLNTSLSSLAYDYNSSLTTISKYFHRTLYQIHESLKWANLPTKPEIAIRHLPQNFQSKFGNKRIFIVDCFEIFCQNPSDLKAATSLYSNYKKHETVKYMIAIDPLRSM
ncbi:uncharacterized protein LOC120422838 [Culex pipiens pallens]|uniref:uncharacterized protein LOC120422838 n=1 Tax=Culex pipiens pallens TaxID=42434 RepID=UPI0019542AE6|nr:uncharacterized protein LOC120422838 [Culex pipiens pallens]